MQYFRNKFRLKKQKLEKLIKRIPQLILFGLLFWLARPKSMWENHILPKLAETCFFGIKISKLLNITFLPSITS